MKIISQHLKHKFPYAKKLIFKRTVCIDCGSIKFGNYKLFTDILWDKDDWTSGKCTYCILCKKCLTRGDLQWTLIQK